MTDLSYFYDRNLASGDKIARAGPVQVFRGKAWSQLVEAAIIQDLLQEVPGMAGSQRTFG
jgi:hypothetical protein